MFDQSPQIEKLTLWRVMERASALQLRELAYEMVCAMHEVPQLQELRQCSLITQAELADAMAIAFEAGCNYAASEATEDAQMLAQLAGTLDRVRAVIDQSGADMQA
jgi:hypothetical protein